MLNKHSLHTWSSPPKHNARTPGPWQINAVPAVTAVCVCSLVIAQQHQGKARLAPIRDHDPALHPSCGEHERASLPDPIDITQRRMHSPGLVCSRRSSPETFGLLCIQNFGMVETDLYRSGQPNELNLPFLEQLRLRTIIFLSAEEPSLHL